MPFRSRNIARETVAAIAVMAIYILVLLAPLHWSICSSLAPQNETGKPPAVAKCAAAGIGKNEIAVLAPAVVDLGMVRAVTPVRYAQAAEVPLPAWHRSSGQPRAPPTA